MPTIEFNESTQKNAQEVYKSIKVLLETDSDLRKLDSSYECQFDDSEMSGTAKGKKFEANLSVLSSQCTEISLTIKLPLLLTPFKGMIEKIIRKKLDLIVT